MDAINNSWSKVQAIPGANWVLGVSGLAISLLIAYYFVKLFRDMAVGESQSTADHLSQFRRLRNEGKLEDEEFEKLTGSMPRDVDFQEVKDNDK